LATYGTEAYREAVETTLRVSRDFARDVERRDGFTLLLQPQLSVVLFRPDGWAPDRYDEWTRSRARAGFTLIVPTTWRSERCYRICLVNPLTTTEMLTEVLDDMAAY
jgi:glutamate/tyrosine decarboxylase-like PLP-dependent enzyme